HFEMIPDRLPEALRQAIARFPPGALQFEVGVQTFDEQVAALISRRQDNARLEENLRWLREHGGVHIHTDLIAGLPAEDLGRFSRYWDLYANSGNFAQTLPMLWQAGASPFARFMGLSDWLYARLGRNHAIGLRELAEQLFLHLTTVLGVARADAAESIWQDY